MNIINFKETSTLEKKGLYDLIKGTDLTYNKTCIEMIRTYESDVFNDGNNVFILFENGNIKGSLAVITKEIGMNGDAYVTDIYIGNGDVEIILSLLMNRVTEYCNILGAVCMKIGVRENEGYLIPYINKLEFAHVYDAVVMNYIGGKDIDLRVNNDMKLLPLCILNSHEYMNIHNEVFKNSPNGSSIDEVEVKDYIVRVANNEDLVGICYYGEKPCGIYELSIDGNIGWINTLGIKPICQNRGLGKELLVECIKKLYEMDLDIIKLLVITSNNIAVTMYKGNGLEEERVFSYWFKKDLHYSTVKTIIRP